MACRSFGRFRQASTRFEAPEPLRQGVRQHFGAPAEGAAAGLPIRHDHGSQHMSAVFQSAVFQDEPAFLGAGSSPAFVRAPEGNGCAERFIRTLKENLPWVQTFGTVEQLRLAPPAGLPRDLQHHLAHPAARIPDTSRHPSGPAFTRGTRRTGSLMVSHQPGPVQARALAKFEAHA